MSNRDVGFLALGRFLAVERYCQSTQPSRAAKVGRADWLSDTDGAGRLVHGVRPGAADARSGPARRT
jgi:hypothetical protein